MSLLQQIKNFAKQAHGDQQRQFMPEPYIAHPIRVMERCSEYTDDRPVLAAALLHDVLEDTTVTKKQMQDFLLSVMNEKDALITLQLVVELTDVYIKKNYPTWNRRKRKQREMQRLADTSSEAQTIKYADIIDNSLTIQNAESDFVRKYLFECRDLLRSMKKGNPALRDKAIYIVQGCIGRVETPSYK